MSRPPRPAGLYSTLVGENWTLKPGDRIKRTELHRRFGGRGQGGIGPSAQTPNVFIFTDPSSGEQHGYRDVCDADGCFCYTGEGQKGDQERKQGNAAILNHRADGRQLRVFHGTGGIVEYDGEFEIDRERPWYYDDAPESGAPDRLRQVIVFRLRPLDRSGRPRKPTHRAAQDREILAVPVEEQHTERALITPGRDPHEAERAESQLVQKYRSYAADRGEALIRHRIVPPGEPRPIVTDLYSESRHLLIEAKGSATREAVRMAIGQLADYARFFKPPPRRAILLPSRPREDLE